MVALPTDVARSGKPARSAFGGRLPLHGQRPRAQLDPERPSPPRHRARHCLTVHRRHGGGPGLVDPALAEELRDASMAVALDLGGWSKHPKSKNGKFKAAAHPQSNEPIARDIRTPPTSIFLRPRR